MMEENYFLHRFEHLENELPPGVKMLSARFVQLIETHARSLAEEVVEDLFTNEHTHSHARIPREEFGERIFAFYQNLGNWIGEPKDDAIRAEYEEWGRIRCRQEIPLSEIVYSLIVIKKHLRRYIREYGPVVYSGDRVTPGELVPVELYSIQELNYVVGDFFDRALYYLTRGYERQAKAKKGSG
jgi:hypothetical protein